MLSVAVAASMVLEETVVPLWGDVIDTVGARLSGAILSTVMGMVAEMPTLPFLS